MDSERTLCARCVKDYRAAGFFVIPDIYHTVKTPCDICGRPGLDYLVEEMQKKERNRQ